MWSEKQHSRLYDNPIKILLIEKEAERLSEIQKNNIESDNYLQVVIKGIVLEDIKLINSNNDTSGEGINKAIYHGYISSNSRPFRHIIINLLKGDQISFYGIKYFDANLGKWSEYIYKEEGEALLQNLS